jgi:hypothetical protein
MLSEGWMSKASTDRGKQKTCVDIFNDVVVRRCTVENWMSKASTDRGKQKTCVDIFNDVVVRRCTVENWLDLKVTP